MIVGLEAVGGDHRASPYESERVPAASVFLLTVSPIIVATHAWLAWLAAAEDP